VKLLELAAGAGFALAVLAGVILLTGVPYEAEPSGDSVIRLSWRAVGERVEECRTPTEEELAAVPKHMRRTEICEGRLTPFRLSVGIDAGRRFEGTIHPSGAREDRPTYVFQEFRVEPGRHHVEIRFEVVPPAGTEAGTRPPLLFDEILELAPRQVALITHDRTQQALRVAPRSGEARTD
jgi:hypothetical protein